MTIYPSISLPTFRPLRRSGAYLMMGGVLWIAHYALQLVGGLSIGQAATTGPLALSDGACFSGAIVTLCLGLGMLAWWIREQMVLALTAIFFATIAASSMLIGLVRMLSTDTPPGLWGGIGVIGSCLSATIVALALKRSHALPSRLTSLLLWTGLATFPLILAFIWPGQFVPAFLTGELPFALAGAAYWSIGRALQKL